MRRGISSTYETQWVTAIRYSGYRCIMSGLSLSGPWALIGIHTRVFQQHLESSMQQLHQNVR